KWQQVPPAPVTGMLADNQGRCGNQAKEETVEQHRVLIKQPHHQMRHTDQTGGNADQQRQQKTQVEMVHQTAQATITPGTEGAWPETLDGKNQLFIDPRDEGNGSARYTRHSIGSSHAGTAQEYSKISLQRMTPSSNGTKRTGSRRSYSN